jgi:hypothetical protein
MSTHDEDRLRRQLRTHARRGTPQPVTFEAVTTTARRIRRRRTTLAALSTAAVVALAVPLGVALTGTLDQDPAPPVAGQSASPTPSGVPRALVEVSLVADAKPGGDGPDVAHLRGREIVAPDGDALAVPGSGTPVSLTVFGDVWLVGKDLGEGRYALDTVDAAGGLIDSVATTPDGPVLSEDGTVAAYVGAEGDVRLLTEQDGDRLLSRADQFTSPAVAGVVGSQGCADTGDGPGACKVALNLGEGGARYVTATGGVEDVPGYRSVADLSMDWVLGTVSADDDGSCSALESDGVRQWRTCDNSFGRASPDERYAIGLPAYLDGLGPSSVSIVDMADGRELVRYAAEGRTNTFVRQAVWESDTSLLITAWDGQDRSWSILRGGLDGSLEEVETGISGTETEPTVHLAAR